MTFLALLLLTLTSGPNAFARGDVVLFGGGGRPVQALRALVEAAGGAGRARFLIIAWASEDPADTASGVRGELLAAGAAEANVSLAPPSNETEARGLSEGLERATGIFFSGGDQMRLLDGLDRTPAARIRIGQRWQAGLPLAGTSAGTAALSERVFTGAEDLSVIDASRVALRPGLGILSNVIIDQHFIVRQRENRLFSAVLRFPGALGVGVDEGTALLIRGGGEHPLGIIIGPTAVLFVEGRTDGRAARLAVTILREGECWDFVTRAPCGRP